MVVIIKRKPTEPKPVEAPNPERTGVHLRATIWELGTVGGKANRPSPLCGAHAGQLQVVLARQVTCPCCLEWIADRLKLPEYLTVQQWAIIGRDPMPGAPDGDKGEAYPNPLPPRNAYGRTVGKIEYTGGTRTGRFTAEEKTKTRPVVKAIPKTEPTIYDDF